MRLNDRKARALRSIFAAWAFGQVVPRSTIKRIRLKSKGKACNGSTL